MATYTTNYNLKKPAQDDVYSIEDFNGNMDIIDANIMPDGSVSTIKIQDGAVTAAKIAAGAVPDPTEELNTIRREIAIINLKRLAEGRTEDAVNNFGIDYSPSVSFNATLDDAYTDITTTASSGQKVVIVEDTTDFAVGEEITIQDNTNTENHIIDTIDSATQITLKTNLTNTYAKGAVYRSTLFNELVKISNMEYDNINFSLSSQTTYTHALFVNPEGNKLYIGADLTRTIYQYSLSTPWDLSTISFDSISVSFSAQMQTIKGLFFKPDGTKLYIAGQDLTANDTEDLFQYSLSTPWDISTASFDNINISITDPHGLFFKPDGTKLYLSEGTMSADRIRQRDLTIPWDISSVSTSTSFTINESSIVYDVSLSEDGNKMYVLTDSSDRIYQYSLSTPWEATTASYDGIYFSVTTQDSNPTGLFFKSDLTKMYVLGASNDRIYQYSTPVLANTTFIQRVVIDTSNTSITQIAHYVEDNKVATDIQEAVSVISTGDETYQAMDKALFVDKGDTQENVFTKTVVSAGDTVVIRRTITKSTATDYVTISQEVGGLA